MRARFTAWLSDEEDERMRAKARELGTSRNYLFRIAVRQFLGMPTVGFAVVTTEEAPVDKWASA